jgi:HEAT repeat protein
MHKNKRVAVVLTALMMSGCAMRAQTKAKDPLVETVTALEPVQTKRIVQRDSVKKQVPKKPEKRAVETILVDLKHNEKRFNALYELRDVDFASMDENQADLVKNAVLDVMKFDSEVLVPGIMVLGKIADPYTVPDMARYSLNTDSRVRVQVAKSLGNIPTDDSILVLIDLMGDRRVTVGQMAVDSLAKIGSPALKHLTAVLANGNTDLQYAAVEALSKIGAGAVAHVVPLLGHPDSKVVYHAVTTLGNIGEKSAMVSLHDVMSHNDSNVRGTAANALRKLGDKSSITVLAQVAENDSSDFVRAAARHAVKELSQ